MLFISTSLLILARDRGQAEGVPGLTDQQLEAMMIPDAVFPAVVHTPDGTALPWNLTGDELREACRALKGSILRQEVYRDFPWEANRPPCLEIYVVRPLQLGCPHLQSMSGVFSIASH